MTGKKSDRPDRWDAFWDRCEDIREERDIKMKPISDRAMRSRDSYEKSKSAGSPPQLDLLEGICRVLDVDAHYLMTGLGTPRPFIPEDVPPADRDTVYAAAFNLARRGKAPQEAVDYVRDIVRPDPRLGVRRIAHLVYRAWGYLAREAAREERSAAKTANASARPPRARHG